MKTKWTLILLSLMLTLASGSLWAQSDRATITGRVTDSTGAVIPNVHVTATQSATNAQTSVTTNNHGLYTVLNLPIGEYTLTFTSDGFQKFERKGLVLSVSQVAEVDAVLQVGAASQVVTVTENASVLQTQSASISTNLSNNIVNDLPLNVYGGRNLSSFMFAYVPSVEGNDYDSHIAGSLSKTKEVMIDGTSAVSQIGGYLSESAPPMESVQEFQVSTTGMRADEGRSGGGVFRYELRSGTNQWHGTAFGFLHNEILDANSWNNKYHQIVDVKSALAAGDTTRAAFLKNLYRRPKDRLFDYGGSFGGPIVKDKTFFYAAVERYTFDNFAVGSMSQTVPTTAFLNGDFGALLNKNVVIGTDSGGNTVYQGAIIDPTTGLAFPNNVIPANRISAVSQKIVDIYKKYYQPLAPGFVQNNAMPAYSAPWYHTTSFSIKLDQYFSQKHHVYGSYIYSQTPRILADQGGIWAPGTTDGGPLANAYNHRVKAPSFRVSDSYTISNNLLNVANFTFNRFHNPSVAISQKGGWPTALGIGNTGAGNFPVIRFNGINSDQLRTAADGTQIAESPLGSQFNDFYTANTFIFNDNLSWVKGRHVLKFGAEFRAMQFNSHGDYGVSTIAFDPAQTAGSFGGNAGFGFASFLLGDVNQASVSMPNNIYGRRKGLSLYVTDDYKVNQKLTLFLDLRWDFNGRYHEKYGHWSNFNTTAINPVTGQPGVLEFAKNGSDSFERNQYWLNFAPNIGGSYEINSKTVARASFSVFYVPLNLNTWGGVPYGFNPGYVLNNQVLTPFNWDHGYPGQAVNIGKDPNFTKWGMVSVDPRSLEMGNVQQWMVGVERELSSNMRLDVNFIQNHGYHLQSGYLAANQAPLSAYTAMNNAGQMWNWVTKPGYNNWSGFGWAAVQPFPTVAMTWGPLFYVGTPLGNSDYKALQFTVTKRAGSGLSMMASYTLSAAHGDTDTAFSELWWAGPLQDVYAKDKNRNTIASFDQTNVVKGYINYQLPFGKGKTFLPNSSGMVNALVGGWTISSGFHYASGTPLRITSTNWYPGMNNVAPNIVPGCNLSGNFHGQIGGTYFNPACFTNPAYGSFGNAPTYLSNLRGFGLATEDIGLNKDFSFGADGRMKLNVRFDLFNAFNRHSYAGPNTGVDANLGKIMDGGGTPGPRQGQLGARFVW